MNVPMSHKAEDLGQESPFTAAESDFLIDIQGHYDFNEYHRYEFYEQGSFDLNNNKKKQNKMYIKINEENKENIEEEIQLSPELARIVKNDLREDASTRKHGLQQLREWIAKCGDMHNCRTDTNFLLRFLRAKKFSVPMSQQMILKYLNLRDKFKHFFYNLDYLEPTVYNAFKSGVVLVSPFRDANGRRVVLYSGRRFNPKVNTSSSMSRLFIITYETLMEDPMTQILGLTHIADVGESDPSAITLWSPVEFARVVKWGEQSLPMRHKEIHSLNLPLALKYVHDYAITRVSEKIKNRAQYHNSLNTLLDKVDRKCLPKEYGGDMPLSEMIDSWMNELKESRERLLALDNMELLNDKNIITRNNPAKNVTGLEGSFRKLEID